MRRFRFGHQIRTEQIDDPVASAHAAEAAGFDTVLVADHVGPGLAPMPTLAAIAAVTQSIRVGTFVLNADMRNPVQLAWEASTIDQISGGRFELGLGAGHTPHEYAETGIELLPAHDRKAALMERIEVIRRLLDGDTVSADGRHHQLDRAKVRRTLNDRLPILVGGNGATLLGHAGAHADIIGLQGLGRTLEDGHRHEVRWSVGHLDAQVEHVRAGAGDRFGDVELNALVQVVDITEDAERSLHELSNRLDRSVEPDELAEIPYVLVGTVDEIAAKIVRCRKRWGITYFAVRELTDFAPVIRAVRAHDT